MNGDHGDHGHEEGDDIDDQDGLDPPRGHQWRGQERTDDDADRRTELAETVGPPERVTTHEQGDGRLGRGGLKGRADATEQRGDGEVPDLELAGGRQPERGDRAHGGHRVTGDHHRSPGEPVDDRHEGAGQHLGQRGQRGQDTEPDRIAGGEVHVHGSTDATDVAADRRQGLATPHDDEAPTERRTGGRGGRTLGHRCYSSRLNGLIQDG